LARKHPSRPFNPLLANAFFRAGFIESWGRGIEKIKRACQEHSIAAPIFDFGMAGLMLNFRANPVALKAADPATTQPWLGDRLGGQLGENRAAIVQAMRDNPKITSAELAELLKISTTAIDKNLRYLRLHGHIRRVGPAKGGHWVVLTEAPRRN
jgi:ATP-dependent DNA helicase RecG